MRWNFQDWVEEVKGKPEPIRRRYVVGCVVASMFFVMVVWSLTVSENFKRISATQGTASAPGSFLPKPSDFSLDDVLSGAKSVETTTPTSGEEFLRGQIENRTRINPDEEGIMPKDDRMPQTTEPTLPVR